MCNMNTTIMHPFLTQFVSLTEFRIIIDAIFCWLPSYYTKQLVVKIKEGEQRNDSLLNLLYLVAKRGDKLSIVFLYFVIKPDLQTTTINR